MSKSFKNLNNFDKRISQSEKILKKYPDRVPIIIEKHKNSNISEIDKNKYLVPVNLTVGQLVYVIRRRLKLEKETALFIFCNDILPPTSSLVIDIYNEYKDDDKFLYITYSSENAFG